MVNLYIISGTESLSAAAFMLWVLQSLKAILWTWRSNWMTSLAVLVDGLGRESVSSISFPGLYLIVRSQVCCYRNILCRYGGAEIRFLL